MSSLILPRVALQNLNTFNFDSEAEYFCSPTNLRELRAVCRLAQRRQWKITILSGGSNVIVAKKINGLVIHPAMSRYWLNPIDDNQIQIHVEAGVNWAELVRQTTRAGWWGIESLAAIPGLAGAAPVQNIGAYGAELADSLEEVHMLELATGDYQILSAAQCQLSYRQSIFKQSLAQQVIIVRIVLKLTRYARSISTYPGLAERINSDTTSAEIAQIVTILRQQKLPDPQQIANVGSFFHNPIISKRQANYLQANFPDIPLYVNNDGVKVSAGWLIEQCGFKGQRDGAFGVYEKQALVVVHYGGGDISTLMAFAAKIQQAVWQRFQIQLQIEPRVLN